MSRIYSKLLKQPTVHRQIPGQTIELFTGQMLLWALWLLGSFSGGSVFAECIHEPGSSSDSIQVIHDTVQNVSMSWDILTPRDRLRMEQITTYFENSTIQFQYAYIEDIGDKQGFTGGRIGFISSQSMASLVDGYCKDDSSPKLCSFREVLDRLQATHSPSTRDLGPAFVDAWKAAAMDSRFRSAQDEANYQWYLKPALMTAKTYGVSSVLGREILYDTHVQQGSDWLEKLASRTTQILHGTPMSGVSEARWLKTYLALRRKEQLNPKDKPDPASARVWAETVYRTDFLAKLLKDGNFELNGPIYMDPQDKENTDSIVR